ncbi:hypothetical protein KA005_27650 [bacterium]|nr:hypothetical protein [bacterium]
MITAEKLFKTLTGFVAMNQAFDLKNGEPDKTVLKARAANYGLIRQAVIAGDFITGKGLDKQYRKYEKKVDLDVSKIVVRNQKDED